MKTQMKTTAVYTKKTNSGDLARCQSKENCPTMIQWYLTIRLMNTPKREWVGLQREGKSEKEIVGQEKRVKSEGKKNDFGFVFESQ